MALQRVGHDQATKCTHTHTHTQSNAKNGLTVDEADVGKPRP